MLATNCWKSCAWCLTLCLAVGCGGAKEEKKVVDGGAAPAGEPAAKSAPAPADDDPAAAVMAALEGVKSGRLQQSYDFFPPSYQKDVDSLVNQFAGKMDPEIWQQSFAVLNKAVQVLKTKKDLILEGPLFAGPDAGPQGAIARQNWDGAVAFLETLVSSDLADLEKLKALESRMFLEKTGNQLLTQALSLGTAAGQNPLETLKDVTVTVVSRDGDKAVVKMASPQAPEPEEVAFVKVEGKWLPQSLVDGWKEQIDQARAQIDQIKPEDLAAAKPQALGQLKSVDATLDKLLAAKTADEITAAAAPLVFQAMMAGQMFNTPAASSSPKPVTIRIVGELSDSQASELAEKLRGLADDALNAETTVLPPENGHTTIELSGVKSVSAFAEKLEFASVKAVDKTERVIEIELK
ncbi:MAG TPA: hypothetical protein VL132_08140 [Planctomycetaceae bacterium]|nr:hypothetical protein [Planctomycetaceae bacterium]